MTSTSVLLDLLNGKLNWLKLSQPIFYQHEFALRFGLELRNGISPLSMRQVKQSCHRSCEIYHALIEPGDSMLLVAEVILPVEDQPAEAHQLKLWHDYLHESISQRQLDRVRVDDPKRLDEECHRFLYTVPCRAAEIRHEELIRAIVIQDLWLKEREPSVREPFFFMDLDKNACFHVYDDRGLDLAAEKPDVLLPLYREYNDWLLDYDLERMDSVFSDLILRPLASEE